jgi:hypothetical protein
MAPIFLGMLSLKWFRERFKFRSPSRFAISFGISPLMSLEDKSTIFISRPTILRIEPSKSFSPLLGMSRNW